MKKTLTVTLSVIIVLLVVAIGFAYVNKDNISSVITAAKYNSDEIESKIQQSNNELKDNISTYFDSGLREFSDTEKLSIFEGKVTAEEVLSNIINETPKKSEKTAEGIIQKYTSKLFSLEAKYIGSIEGVLSEAIDEYKKLPPEKRGYGGKVRVMQKYQGRISSLESSCDAEVNSLVSALKAELKAINADTTIINTINKTYENEKNLKKAYYINKYI